MLTQEEPVAAWEGTRPTSLLSDAALSTIAAVGSTCISGVASILITRGLGVSGRGRWAVISSLAVIIASVGAIGLPTAAAYAGARVRGAERERVLKAGLALAAVLGLLAALIYLAAAAVIEPPASTIAVALGAAIPTATIWYSVAHQLNLTVTSMRWFALAPVVNAVVTFAVVAALYAAGELSVLAVVLVSGGGSLIGAGVSVLGLRHSRVLGSKLALIRPSAAVRVLRPYAGYAAITFATLSLTQIVQRVDVLLVNGFRGPHQAGLYAVAVQVTDLMLVVPAALGLVMFRRGARSAPAHYRESVRILRWTAGFGLAAAAVALATSAWIVPHVFGAGFRGSVTPLRWLLPGTIAFSLQSVLSQYLAGRGRPRVVLLAWLAGAVGGFGADLVVIPAYGIAGAAVVSSASYALVTMLHFLALRAMRRREAAAR